MLLYKPDKIILGCTHYPYLLNVLSKFIQPATFINPAQYFAQSIYEDLKNNNLLCSEEEKEHTFFVSKNPAQFAKASKLFYKVQEVKEISLQ